MPAHKKKKLPIFNEHMTLEHFYRIAVFIVQIVPIEEEEEEKFLIQDCIHFILSFCHHRNESRHISPVFTKTPNSRY